MAISAVDANSIIIDVRTGKLTKQGFLLLSSINELPSYTVDTLPSALRPGRMIFVTDEAGGAQPAFADGADWRRFTDRAVVS